MTALREVKFLRELHSPHIVRLLDVFPQKRGISLVRSARAPPPPPPLPPPPLLPLIRTPPPTPPHQSPPSTHQVFEYMESDLEAVIKDRSLVLSAADVKAYLRMVLQALAHCHARWVVHRDVKPNNFLVAASGELRLGDFGLARLYGSPERRYTNQVFARWYRPPELLYGSTCYGPGVDVWAAGCVFAELLLRRPWFPGESDVEILTKIFTALGTPTGAPAPAHTCRLPAAAQSTHSLGSWAGRDAAARACVGTATRSAAELRPHPSWILPSLLQTSPGRGCGRCPRLWSSSARRRRPCASSSRRPPTMPWTCCPAS